jgi:DNA-binding response OmpR family regulator
MKILVCDDDREIVNAVAIFLRNEGYEPVKAYTGQEALAALDGGGVALVSMDGMRATMTIRERSNIPVIMLSAKSEDTDKILGLNMGADDYITKPFNPLELLARVKSQLRRYTKLGGAAAKAVSFATGGLAIDDERKEVLVDGDAVRLTPVEYRILLLLTENAGRVFSNSQIYERVWNEPGLSPENTVAVHIRRIREKIEINPREPKYLKVVWGVGYKVEKYPVFRVD